MSDTLQNLVQQLTQEGQLDSRGSFSLAASQIQQRYGQLLAVHPELPWLSFLRYGYRVRARRLRCHLDLRECLLSLTGSPELAAIEQALVSYPQSTDADSALMHEVLWWFLAQEPQLLSLRVKSGRGHLQLQVRPQDFSLQSGTSPMEDEWELKVRWGWRGSLRKAARRAQIQQAIASCLPLYPARVEWDGGLKPLPLAWPGRHRMLVAYLVPRQQAEKIPHLALPLNLRAAHKVGISGNLETPPTDTCDCDWLVLRQKTPGDVAQDGERTRVRLLFRYGPDTHPARFLPVRDGCLLQPIELEWIRGVTVISACPPDLKTDLTGLKLAEGPELHQFLRHLRQRWIEEIQSLQTLPQFDLAPLAQALQLGNP